MRAVTYLLVALAGLVVLPWDTQIIPGPLLRDESKTAADQPLDTPTYSREIVYFPCSGVKCQAWLYKPKHHAGSKPPVIIAAHGLGAQKDFGLEIYGERFAEAGIASLIFDYRTFGGSGGEPRHWVSPSRHLEDWQSAVGYVQSQLGGTVDTSKLMLWGTSFAGGHVLVTAAKLGSNVTAVISQVPFLDGKASFARSTKERGLGKIIRAVIAALHDSIRSLFHYPAAYYPLVGEPGGWNFMGLGEQDMADYYAKHPAKYQGGWRNMARCKLALEVGNYRPINFVPQITAPVLYIAATKDKLCPVDEVQAAANITANGQLVAVDKSHFQVYSGDALEYLLDKQVYFLRTAAGLPAVTTAEDS